MRIVLDLQACQSEGSRNRGIGRYSLSLARAIAELRGDHELRIALNALYPDAAREVEDQLAGLVPFASFSHYHYLPPDRPFGAEGEYRRAVASALIRQHYAQLQPDVLHISSVFEGLVGQAVVPTQLSSLRPVVRVATLYDLIPLVFKDVYLRNREIKRWYYEKLGTLKECDLLLSISESSRQDAIDYLDVAPERIVNISGAADPHFRPIETSPDEAAAFRQRYGIAGAFVLYTGGIDYRKNVEGLIDAYAKLPGALRKTYQLVIVCSIQPEQRSSLIAYARKRRLAKREIIFTGFVPDDDLVLFYNLCTLFVFPSFYAGFGLPVLEAMACGAPVIGGDSASIPEVIDRNDALFDNSKTESIAAAMHRALTEHGFRSDLARHGLERAKDFSWTRSGRLAIDAFERAHRCKRVSDAIHVAGLLPRRKIAYFSPLPDSRSGIAEYSAELLPELARYFDLDLFIDDYEITDPWLVSNFKIFSWAQFPARRDRYDTVLYHFGNSEFHAHMYELLQRYPGVVVLHDFFVGTLIRYMEAARGKMGFWLQELNHAHGPGVCALLQEPGGMERAIREFPCNRRIFDHANGVIVHSSYPLELIRRFYPHGVNAPLHIVKQMRGSVKRTTGEDALAIRQSLGFAANDFLVCSFGFLVFTKLNEVLVEAFSRSHFRDDSRARLIFIGGLDPGVYGQKLLERIKKCGLEHRILITGYQDAERYRAYLAIADIAVQLRAHSRGETSRAVLDCLAHGVPLIVNAYATLDDYPDDVVYKIPPDAPVMALTHALEELWDDTERRRTLSERGPAYIAAEHNPEEIAAQYAITIETSIQRSAATRQTALTQELGCILAPYQAAGDELQEIAQCALANRPDFQPPRVLIDVSYMIRVHHLSGIQRVVRNITRCLYQCSDSNYRPEAVRLHGDALYHAKGYVSDVGEGSGVTKELLGAERFLNEVTEWSRATSGGPIDIGFGDVLLMLDSSWASYEQFTDIYVLIRRRFGRVYTVVYDLIPILHPEFFPLDLVAIFSRWLTSATALSDGLVCISRSVADELIGYIGTAGLTYPRDLKIGYFNLGADIPLTNTDEPVRSSLSDYFQRDSFPVFLMVGTIEPRKGHAFVLDAFEELWASGFNIGLCIAGRQGWNVKPFMARLKCHPEFQRRLFWAESPSDAEVIYGYQHAKALIFASIAEGFGLPIVEAAQHGLPVLCSDIPVFREVGGEHVTYFSLDSPACLAETVRAWLRQPTPPDSSKIPWLTWEQSTAQLLDVILNNKWYKVLPAHAD
jgi:glycosyltransferase involved in cell wall biosynthesis